MSQHAAWLSEVGYEKGKYVMRGITYCMVAALVCFGAVTSARADIIDGLPAAGAVELVVDITTGVMKVEGNVAGGVSLSGYSITSASSSLVADGDGAAAPFTFYLSNTTADVTAGNLAGSVAVPPPLTLDAGFNTAGSQDLVFNYSKAGVGGSISGAVIYVPEPVTLTLLGIGGLALLRRRRR